MFSSIVSAFTNLFTKNSGVGGYHGYGAMTKAGQQVNSSSSLKISAFWCAINTIAESYALLPKSVFKATDDKKQRDRSHPIDYLIHEEPNSSMTAPVFDFIMVVSYFLKGNAIALIKRNNSGVVTAKEYVDPDTVSLVRENAKSYYRIAGKLYNSSEVIHVPFFTTDGLWGYDIIQFAADNIGVVIGVHEFHGNSFTNKGLSAGVIQDSRFDYLELQLKAF